MPYTHTRMLDWSIGLVFYYLNVQACPDRSLNYYFNGPCHFCCDTPHAMDRRSTWRYNHCLTLYFGWWLYAAVSPKFEYDMSRSHSRPNRRSNHINANPPEYRINLESPSLTISQTISITSPKPSASPLSVSPTGIAFSRNYSLGHLRSLFLTFHPHF